MYENLHYIVEPNYGRITAIAFTIGDKFFCAPLDPANSDFAAIMALVAEGKLTIAPAEGAE